MVGADVGIVDEIGSRCGLVWASRNDPAGGEVMAHEAGAPRAEEAEILPLHCRENAGTPTGPPEGRHIFCVLGEDGDEFVELGPVAGVSVAEDKLFRSEEHTSELQSLMSI